jgi:hypothetical protein
MIFKAESEASSARLHRSQQFSSAGYGTAEKSLAVESFVAEGTLVIVVAVPTCPGWMMSWEALWVPIMTESRPSFPATQAVPPLTSSRKSRHWELKHFHTQMMCLHVVAIF